MGRHICLYYEAEKNLLDLVSFFFEQGFQANELCVWVVPQSLGIAGAKAALGKKIKDLDTYIEKGQFELLSHEDVYLKSGIFNQAYTLSVWAKKQENVSKRGFSGFRASGDASWLSEKDWNKWVFYERNAGRFISKSKITALCTYPSKKFDIGKLFSLSLSHEVLIRREEDKADILMDKRDIFE